MSLFRRHFFTAITLILFRPDGSAIQLDAVRRRLCALNRRRYLRVDGVDCLLLSLCDIT